MLPLIFVDVDGTLVGTTNDVRPEVWDAADALRAQGAHLVLCSGRPGFAKAREYAERLDPDGWHVFQNGASVVHLPTGATRSRGLPPDRVDWLTTRARETGRILELYTDHEYAVAEDTPRTRQHATLLGAPFVARPFDALAGSVVRAQWLLGKEEVDLVVAEPHFGLNYAPSVSPVMPDTTFVNITAEGVDKGLAVRLVAEAYGVPLGRVMMVGDGGNDVPAMQAVGYPVAMGNAEPEARAVAWRVVADVDAGGLCEAFALAEGL